MQSQLSALVKIPPRHAMATIHEALTTALSYLQAGRPHEAAQICQQILQAMPDSAEAWNYLGAAARQLGRRDVAVASLQRATALRPDFVEAHNELGTALQELGRFDE